MNYVRQQFSFDRFWSRVTRMVIAGGGYIMGLGNALPGETVIETVQSASLVQWTGFVVAMFGASLKSKK